MFLIVADRCDASASWFAESMKAHGVESWFVTPVELVCARWVARMDDAGDRIALRLPDDRTLDVADVRGTLNRFAYLPPDLLEVVHLDDRDYAAQELFALCLMFLDRLPQPVWNTPTTSWLVGSHLHELHWSTLAARAGFGLSQDAIETSVLVVDELVVDAATEDVASACRRLAELSGNSILEVHLSADRGFVRANPCADLRRGGEKLIDHVLARVS